MLKLAAIIGTVVIGVTALFFYYAGMFDRVELTRETRGPYQLVYREHHGPYNEVRYVMNTVYRYVRDTLHLKTGTGFAAFYDDPQEGSDSELRSICGVVVDDSVPASSPYKSGIFRRTDAVIGTVRLRSFFSYAVGGYRFYAHLRQFTEKHKITRAGPVFELYDMSGRTIQYIAPIGKSASPVPEFGGN